ncbi:molybdopterin-dependent oxidoreductase [Ruegeria pomeroyi]|nr:molybdopterin-dependent oxidoreductase [Ruegeria pomeroyi]
MGGKGVASAGKASALLRVEDPALLTGRARFVDDLSEPAGTLHAAILRSPHAHARILKIDISRAAALRGVFAIHSGAELAAVTDPLLVGVKVAVESRVLAVDRVRYVGEPVAVVLAESRYLAEDALDLIEVSYQPLAPVTEIEAALDPAAPVLHEELGHNIASDRSFAYGDPAAAMARAPHRISVSVHYPRNSCTPMETYGVVASHDPDEGFDILANFQGPFSIHAVLARALKVPGNRLRLRTPPQSGGSFGVKQGVFPYMVLMAGCARLAGRPVKWIEDRLEHLTASVSGTARTTILCAAVEADGRVTALDWDQIEDVGAYVRAPEPATLYRMHGNMCGAYDIAHLAIRNRVVMTNKTPTGLNRGFGGPQVYFALERLMARIAQELELDPVAVIRRNLVSAFPYCTASGATYDSGDYHRAMELALADGRYDALRAQQAQARAEGRLFGIGHAAVVEPSVSNMGYLSTVLTPSERAKAGPKNGAQSVASITVDPTGSVTVQIDSVPQGQGHQTVAAGLVAEVLGVSPDRVRVVSDFDTAKDVWSIAAGNYSSRFAAASLGAVRIAAERLRGRLARIAAPMLGGDAAALVFAQGGIAAPGHAPIPFARVASASHWAPGTLPNGESAIRETVIWTPEALAAPDPQDRINSSLCHGFIFDFCGVEIDPRTRAVQIHRYVSMHDCGRILHTGMVEGQVRGGFAHAVGAALYEEFAYGVDGAFLAGTFADYPVPTVHEIPPLEILHIETPSPVTPTGAKGVGEGNCMSTPVCIANAVADALRPMTGWVDLALPITPARIADLLGPEPAAPPSRVPEIDAGDGLAGAGTARVSSSPQQVWEMLMDPEQLAAIIPGAHDVTRPAPDRFAAEVTLGVGPVKGRYKVEVALSDLSPPHSAVLSGRATGALGSGEGVGHVTLTALDNGGTEIAYHYRARIGGKVAAVGGRLLDGAAKMVIGQFFSALGRRAGGGQGRRQHARPVARFLAWLGGAR